MGVAEKIIAGPAPVLQLAEPLPLRVARSCPAVGVQEHEKGRERAECGGWLHEKIKNFSQRINFQH